MTRFDSVGDRDRSRAPIFFLILLALIFGTVLGIRFPLAALVVFGTLALLGTVKLSLWQRDHIARPDQQAVRGRLSREEMVQARSKLRRRPRS